MAFYVSPHQDDWQLFMVPRALADLRKPKHECKVVFIYLTAGDAGFVTPADEYWRGREMGAINSLRAVRGLRDDPKVATTVDVVCGHPIVTLRMMENTVSYFLRLPEDSLKTRPVDPMAAPSAGAELRPLGQETDCFANWNDLVTTLAQILRNESYGTENRPFSWVNYLDPDYGQHLNHIVAGHCIEEAMAMTELDNLPGKVEFKREKFLDYRTKDFPKNVSWLELYTKRRIFRTYDRVANLVSNGRYGSHQYGEYLSWLRRQYTTQAAMKAGLLPG